MPVFSQIETDPEDAHSGDGASLPFDGDQAALRRHLKELLEGEAFRGSNRSAQFLKYILDHYLAGRTESLKERSIGIALFGRQPYYDTSSDAIVRVTASDVRKRLRGHYSRVSEGGYRIALPSGSYVPQITRERAELAATAAAAPTVILPQAAQPTAEPLPIPSPELAVPAVRTPWRRNLALTAIVVLNVMVWVAMWTQIHGVPPAPVPPWSAFFASPRPLMVVTSDPNIAEIQGFTGGQITLSDYANRNYIAHPEKLNADQLFFCRTVLRGDKASTVDTTILAKVAEAAAHATKKIVVRGARSLQLEDLEGEFNYVLLGSPRSNPWANIYNDGLDIRFEFDPVTGRERLHDVRPRPGEQPYYVATAPGWATGSSYAILAFVRNPDQGQDALLLAGETAEGTEAAGKLATDHTLLKRTLQSCGIPHGPEQHFEVLLRLNILAGSPSNVDTVACHAL